MSAKLKRQNRIKEILNNKFISNHEDMLKLLLKEDINITQATLSRDFAELGVIRTFTDQGTRYVLNLYESGKQIARLIGFEILSVEHNESMIVIRTLAGRAQGVAHYIDRLNRVEILGTVGGDDTVIVIPNSHKNVDKVVALIKNMMMQQPDFKLK
ncbi:MAG: arginine repressor [Ignavibacteria bacterium]|jgi:transcriptional regulator of arginine metabolism|nr:arginine repressor [Ignavibacteria bacterium]MCU7502670.1 arginine repressor [Ignavibacteria bacterium]MCU7515127.1 arginine repressor [Ignavibacteria bacterium]